MELYPHRNVYLMRDFVNIQRQSFCQFLNEGLGKELAKIKKITNLERGVEILFYSEQHLLAKPHLSPREAILQGLSYQSGVYIPAQLTNLQTRKKTREWLLIGNLPIMTRRGHFVINGTPWVVVNQMVRKPGVYYKTKGKSFYADIVPLRGSWLRLEIDRFDNCWARLKKTQKIPIPIFFQTLGCTYNMMLQALPQVSFFILYAKGCKDLYFFDKNHPKTKDEAMVWLKKDMEARKFLKQAELEGVDEDDFFVETKLCEIDNLSFVRPPFHFYIEGRLLNPLNYQLGEAGRLHLNNQLAIYRASSLTFLTVSDLMLSVAHFISRVERNDSADDIDNIKNRRVRTSGELIQNQWLNGLIRLERTIQKTLTLLRKPLSLSKLVTTKPIAGSFREFFGTNPLCQYMDQTNPLAELTHKRRVSLLGPGGLRRDTADLKVRGIHATYYGRICPIETPDGKNAGLVHSLAVFAAVNQLGLFYTPLYQVSRGLFQVASLPISLSAEAEELSKVSPGDLTTSKFKILNQEKAPTKLDIEFKTVQPSQIDFVSISPLQMISIGTSLIPFLEHDDANRALMGSNMQRQALPLLIPERPIVGTGLELKITADSGHSVQTKLSGCVSYVSRDKIIVYSQPSLSLTKTLIPPKNIEIFENLINTKPVSSSLKKVEQNRNVKKWALSKKKSNGLLRFKPGPRYRYSNKQKRKKLFSPLTEKRNLTFSLITSVTYHLQKNHRSNQDLFLSARPCINEGDWVHQGDLLSDCSSSVLGDLAVGKNVLIGYISWEGYNFEDAIVLSERLVSDNVYTSLHIERYQVQVEETAAGCEKITRQVEHLVAPIKIDLRKSESVVSKTTLPTIEKFVLYGLPARSTKKGSTSSDTKENNSMLSQIFDHLDENGVVRVGTWVRSNDVLVGKVTPLDKRELLPQERFFYDVIERRPPEFKDTSFRLPNNTSGRVIGKTIFDSPTSDFKDHLNGPKHVCVYIAQQRQIQIGDKLAGRHGNKGIVSIILPREEMPFLPDGTPLDIVLNPLGVPSRMNVGQVFESLLGFAGKQLNQQFQISPFDEMIGPEASRSLVFSKLYETMLKTRKEWLFQYNTPGKVPLFDGRTGQPFSQFSSVGQAYMLKLIHIVDKKIHARSVGPYALVTQQPVRGRSKRGGQRLGEMEVWALEGFGAAYTLQECFTLKSDDLLGRIKVLPAISKEKLQLYMGTPEAFRVAVRELQSLCLKVNLLTSKSSFQKRDPIKLHHRWNKKEGLVLTDVSRLP